jgi:hypothetical protein
LVVNIDLFWAKISLGNVSQAARLRPAPPDSRLKKANENNTKTPSTHVAGDSLPLFDDFMNSTLLLH